SARALLASCAHSRHATHWPQSRLHAQHSSEMLLAYVFSLFLFRPLPLPPEDAVGLQYTTPGKRDKFLRARLRAEHPLLTHGVPPFGDEPLLPITRRRLPTRAVRQL